MYNFDTQLCEFLPEWYRRVKDYQQICLAESNDFETLAGNVNAVADNYFPQTMDAGTLTMWEQALGIVPNPQTESIEFRQARLINRISTRPPLTLPFLYQKLDELIGPGEWQCEVDYSNYTIYIKSSAINQSYAVEVSYTINRIKPAHIVYINQPYVAEGMTLDETVNLTQTIYHYKLGGWGLGINPFSSLEDQGAIVIPSQLSIQSQLLNDTANFVVSDIANARVNGTIMISELTKSASGNSASIEYTVNSSQTNLITQIELLNSSGGVLTSSPVYVPVADPAIITHIIPVQEANANGD